MSIRLNGSTSGYAEIDAPAVAGNNTLILPGGNGAVFDWTILHGVKTAKPWMLSGGLDASNVGEAIHVTRAHGVDVSSGVESAPGIKDDGLIRAFVKAAREAATRF